LTTPNLWVDWPAGPVGWAEAQHKLSVGDKVRGPSGATAEASRVGAPSPREVLNHFEAAVYHNIEQYSIIQNKLA
jgi:hypothetical protein